MNFWRKLKRPFFCLAPMADVTDAAFRRIIAKYGKPAIFFTEFTSADGLCVSGSKYVSKCTNNFLLKIFSARAGRAAQGISRHISLPPEKLFINLVYSKAERPIVAQLFGANPEKMEQAAKLVALLGFDGLDINMGCPDRAVERQGAGAAMIKNPKLAREIIRAAKKGAPDLPISIKTRLGFNQVDLGWLEEILRENLAALTVHLRTRKEMSKVPARWELMPEIIKLRNKIAPDTLIIGNGDVWSIQDAKEKVKKYGCDGVMLGRAIFGKPWLFSRGKRPDLKNSKRPDLEERLSILLEHTKLFEKYFTGIKSFAVMKKHFKAYVSDFDGAKELRMKLMETNNSKEVGKIIKDFLKKF